MNQTLLGGARAMMTHAGVTKGFWAEAMGTAAHVLNRSPRKSLGWKTTFELLFGRIPEISYVRIFGCRAWVFNDQGKKWDPKSIPMVFIGYETGSKAYRLSLGTNSYLLIRYMSSKLQANGKKTSPVITLQMLGFFRIY